MSANWKWILKKKVQNNIDRRPELRNKININLELNNKEKSIIIKEISDKEDIYKIKSTKDYLFEIYNLNRKTFYKQINKNSEYDKYSEIKENIKDIHSLYDMCGYRRIYFELLKRNINIGIN